MSERLGELLIKRNFITPEQLKKAQDEQKLKGGRLESNLVKLGYIKEDELLSFLSAQYRVPSVKISKIEINPNVTKLIPPSISKKYFIIPINRVGPKLTLAMADPSNIVVIDEVKFITGFNVEPVVASETEIVDAIKKYTAGGEVWLDWGQRAFRPSISLWMMINPSNLIWISSTPVWLMLMSLISWSMERSIILRLLKTR